MKSLHYLGIFIIMALLTVLFMTMHKTRAEVAAASSKIDAITIHQEVATLEAQLFELKNIITETLEKSQKDEKEDAILARLDELEQYLIFIKKKPACYP